MSLPTVQRAAVINSYGAPFTLSTTHPVPNPSTLTSDQCLVKILASGCCHSDLHIRDGDWQIFTKPPPFVGGHEGIGLIVGFGGDGRREEVKGFKVGDRVGLKWTTDACGSCELCRTGFDSLCRSVKNCGGNVDGTFQEYMVAWTQHLVPIPPSLATQDAAPILCAGMTVYGALKKSNTVVGNWVAIPGAGGGLGHLAIQYATAMGLRVLAIDAGSSKKETCLSLGAEHFLDFNECIAAAKTSVESGSEEEKATAANMAVVQEVLRVCGGDGLGPHAAIVISGVIDAFQDAVMYLRPRGTLVAVGVPNGILPLVVGFVVAKSLRIEGTMLGNMQDAVEALDLAARGKVKMHTNIRKFEQLNEVFEEIAKGTMVGRAIIEF